MWEWNVFKRIIPAFIALFLGVIFYIGTKYVISGMTSAFNATGYNPADWGLAWWVFGLMGVVVAWAFIMKGWLIISGRQSGTFGGGESDTPVRRKPKPTPMIQPIRRFPWDNGG